MYYFVAKSAQSPTVKLLASEVGGKVITSITKPFKTKPGDIVVNWGRGNYPKWINNIHPLSRYLNPYYLIGSASNKIAFFKAMTTHTNNTVPFALTPEAAAELNSKTSVVSRKYVSAHSGQGCVYHKKNAGNLPVVPLYVAYFSKTYEYRVHIFDKKVIDIVQKRAENGKDSDLKVRTRSNGWVFAHEQNPPIAQAVLDELLVINDSSFGLDFGAFDVMVKKYGSWVLCEINTAPSVSAPTTMAAYKAAILKLGGN